MIDDDDGGNDDDCHGYDAVCYDAERDDYDGGDDRCWNMIDE